MNKFNFKKLILIITKDCNFKCKYCYVRHSKKSINFEIVKKAIDFILDCKGGYKEIILTGGEVLLEFSLVKKLVEYAKIKASRKRKKILIGMPTNGSLINEEIIDFFNENEIHVAISFDGIKEAQDLNRRLKHKKSSFEILTSKFPLYKNIKCLRMRITVTPKTVHLLNKNIRFLYNEGFKLLDVQPVIGYFWSNEDINKFRGQLLELKRFYNLKKDLNIQFIEEEMIRKEKKEARRCPMAVKEICIDIDGKIYPCQFFLNYSDKKKMNHCIGDIKKGLNLKQLKYFQAFKLNNRPKERCKNCVLKGNCSKLCLQYGLKNDLENSEKLIESHCKIEALIYSIFGS